MYRHSVGVAVALWWSIGCGRARFEQLDDLGSDAANATNTIDGNSATVDGSVDAATMLDGPAVAAGCLATETAGTFSLHFDDAQIPSTFQLYFEGSALATIASGVLQLYSGRSTSYAGLIGIQPADMTSHRVFVQIKQMTEITNQVRSLMSVGKIRAGNIEAAVEIVQHGGFLHAKQWINRVENVLSKRAYSPASDQYWQIRETSGRVYYETSADGITFQPLADVATPSWYSSSAQVELASGPSMNESGILGHVRFDEFTDCR